MASVTFGTVQIELLCHAGFRIKNDSKTVIIDPFRLERDFEADILLITHSHFDHFDPQSVSRVVTPKTACIAPADCRGRLASLRSLKPGENAEIGGIRIEACDAYNMNKFRSPGQVFHPKGLGVGYLVTIGGVTVYHTGDTDNIPEFTQMRGRADVLLIPVSGTYVMTPHEAASAAGTINPRIAVPMHYGEIVGTGDDAKAFKKAFPGETKILL